MGAQNEGMEWHMEKRIIIGIITTVLINMGMSIWNTSFLLRTLDTDPSIVNRIIALEYQVSEQGRVNLQILDELREAKRDRKEARKERAEFKGEQSKRTTIVYESKDHMNDRSLHK